MVALSEPLGTEFEDKVRARDKDKDKDFIASCLVSLLLLLPKPPRGPSGPRVPDGVLKKSSDSWVERPTSIKKLLRSVSVSPSARSSSWDGTDAKGALGRGGRRGVLPLAASIRESRHEC